MELCFSSPSPTFLLLPPANPSPIFHLPNSTTPKFSPPRFHALKAMARRKPPLDGVSDALNEITSASLDEAPARRQSSNKKIYSWLLYTAASADDSLGSFSIGTLSSCSTRASTASPTCSTWRRGAGAPEAFWVLYDFAVSPRFEKSGGRGAGEAPSGFKWEVVNRAVHAAARGGSLAFLAELLGGGSGDGVLSYRDAYGSTILHAVAGRGQVE